MTEYEIADLALSKQALFWQATQAAQGLSGFLYTLMERFWTVLVGYLLVTYFIGDKLSRVQAAILTVLYLCWLGGLVNHMTMMQTELSANFLSMNALNPDWTPPPHSMEFTYLFTATLVTASLYFMWSVRHPRE
ncbi:MAG: hypothetical protein ABJN62_15670 [Halioglobus sp.]